MHQHVRLYSCDVTFFTDRSFAVSLSRERRCRGKGRWTTLWRGRCGPCSEKRLPPQLACTERTALGVKANVSWP